MKVFSTRLKITTPTKTTTIIKIALYPRRAQEALPAPRKPARKVSMMGVTG
jgi:hypothetical protein